MTPQRQSGTAFCARSPGSLTSREGAHRVDGGRGRAPLDLTHVRRALPVTGTRTGGAIAIVVRRGGAVPSTSRRYGGGENTQKERRRRCVRLAFAANSPQRSHRACTQRGGR